MKTLKTIAAFCAIILFFSCTDKAKENIDNQTNTKYEIAQKNKKIVVDFYQKVFGDKDFSVIDSVIVDSYIQHNPSVADGREPLKKALKVWLKDAPKTKVDFQHVIAEDDLVVLHIKDVNNGKVTAIVDIFRLKDGKITEHWDAVQKAPEKSENKHPMF
jgi:predicted SnoaL-like aldol condensation-catalyzing enzyme